MRQKHRIFFDMDGTLAVFRKLSTFETLLEPGYFENLSPIQNVVNAAKELIQRDDVEVFILSSYLTESSTALTEKNVWLNKHLPEIDEMHRIFVPCGDSKADYVPDQQPDDVLIDDYYVNLQAWHGVAVKLYNGINGTSGRVWNGAYTNYQSAPSDIMDNIIQAVSGEESYIPAQTFKI